MINPPIDPIAIGGGNTKYFRWHIILWLLGTTRSQQRRQAPTILLFSTTITSVCPGVVIEEGDARSSFKPAPVVTVSNDAVEAEEAWWRQAAVTGSGEAVGLDHEADDGTDVPVDWPAIGPKDGDIMFVTS